MKNIIAIIFSTLSCLCFAQTINSDRKTIDADKPLNRILYEQYFKSLYHYEPSIIRENNIAYLEVKSNQKIGDSLVFSRINQKASFREDGRPIHVVEWNEYPYDSMFKDYSYDSLGNLIEYRYWFPKEGIYGKNKFCNHCQSQVIDFTQLSDNELFSYFKTHQNVCGNFEIEQIAKPISFQYKSLKSFTLLIISSISTALYSKGLNTSSITKPKTEQFPFVNESDNVLIEPSDTTKHKKKIDANKTPLRRKFKKRRRIYLSSRFPFIFRGRRKLLGCPDF